MRFKILLLLELKNSIKKLPQIFIGAIALIIIIGAIAFCGNKYLYDSPIDTNINLVLVVEDDSTMMTYITSMVTNSETFKDIVNITTCTREELPEILDSGKAVAGIILHENAAADIMSSKNTPIEIVFPENSGFEAAMVSEIAKTIASLLQTAQSGVYTSIDFYNENSKYSYKSDMIDRLNFTYIRIVLFRESAISEHTLSGTGNVSVLVYYVVSGIVLFLLLHGINIATVYSNYTFHTTCKLKKQGVSIKKQLLIKYVNILAIYLTYLILFTPVMFLLLKPSYVPKLFIGLFISIMCISSMMLLIYELFKKSSNCIMFIFLSSIFTGFISGCFIPWAMLPGAIKDLSGFLPVKYIIHMINAIITNESIISYSFICIGFSILFFALSIAIKSIRIRRADL